MPLSEQEQRLLDEMERHLMQNDADVVSASASRALSYRNLIYGAILVLVGLAAVIAGIALWNSILALGIGLGVAGFAAMVGGVVLATTPAKGDDAQGLPRTGTVPGKPMQGASFMDRMNDRWDRRQQGR
ncbi:MULTISPECIES: DUF3040 domain-containing protein [Microbacterium]|uniref:DUF3040 domain-containing protein n=1 Tax=Microbacterium barkeri TaxID=33917 RepID=A0A9W6H3F7_9MICO|nr:MULTISPECIES: DUF3040 domain-containing protein [Microbacterium]MDI6943557.1 DUF3040 domain-containing protein [Microbacterium barkeri]MDR6875588.1 hypothetical protein [Microbacterium barkeri]WRH17847.1 DUF3040 domain-containing protein [Microbacterium sp. JZ37]GLJ61563.1 hypothetical protein GCM10017576_16930 [Microbacterium barkeri]